MFDNIKFFLPANIIDFLPTKLHGGFIVKPTFAIHTESINGEMNVNVFCIGMSSNQHLKIITENGFCPFLSYPVCFLRSHFLTLERNDIMVHFDMLFSCGLANPVEFLSCVMLIAHFHFDICRFGIIGTIYARNDRRFLSFGFSGYIFQSCQRIVFYGEVP